MGGIAVRGARRRVQHLQPHQDRPERRGIQQSAQGQLRYLVKRLKGTKAAARALGISQRTVERYVSGKLERPRQGLRSAWSAR